MKRLPLHDAHVSAGAAFCPAGDWEVPARFGSLDEEYAAATHGCALLDVSPLGKVRFTGPDCRDFLHGLLSRDIKNLAPGRGVWACLLTHKGKLVADFSLYNANGRLLALHPAQATPLILQGLAKYLPLSDTRAEDVSDALGAFYLAGPGGEAVLRDLFNGRPEAGGCREAEWNGVAVTLLAYPPEDPEGTLLLFPEGASLGVWQTLQRAGAPHGLRPAGHDLWETLRVEAGRPALGVDAGADSFPAEAGLERAVSYTKGCYLGQEITTRLKTQGRLKDRMVGLKIDGEAAPGADVLFEGGKVGTVTSVARSPRLAATLALATVSFPRGAPGTPLLVKSGGQERAAEVVELPLSRTR